MSSPVGPGRMGEFPNVHELLFHLVEALASSDNSSVLDDIWPDTEITVDDVTGLVLHAHATEIANKQTAYVRGMNDPHGPYQTATRMGALLTELILKKNPT